jgi:hypothetical protein
MSACVICGRDHNDGRRKRCNSCATKMRRYRMKMKAIDYLGGKCILCGYDKHPAAMVFHHRDPSTKEFSFGRMANKSWVSVQEELDKCDLLCSNCHAPLHSERYEEVFLAAIKSNSRNM